MLNLSAREVRRAFARCIFRSGTIPRILRSDRGPEFTGEVVRHLNKTFDVNQDGEMSQHEFVVAMQV